MSPENLKHILDSVRIAPDLVPNQPKEGDTHCNEAVRRVFCLAGFPNVFKKNELANSIIQQVKAEDSNFRQVGSVEAWRSAQEGSLVVAGHLYLGHGHVAMVYPTDKMEHSGSWNKDVPMLSNVGKTVGIMKASEAFTASLGEPAYFVFLG